MTSLDILPEVSNVKLSFIHIARVGDGRGIAERGNKHLQSTDKHQTRLWYYIIIFTVIIIINELYL